MANFSQPHGLSREGGVSLIEDWRKCTLANRFLKMLRPSKWHGDTETRNILIWGWYTLGAKQATIARHYCISRQRVHQIIARIIRIKEA